MNRKFNPVILVGALLLVVGVAVLAVLAGRGGTSQSTTVKALVATRDIAVNAPAATAGLVVRDVKRSDLPAGAVTSLAAVNGQIALLPVPKGTVITTASFGQLGATTDTGVNLPKGKEAVGVELGFAPGTLRYVIPGNKITIWVTQKEKPDANGNVPATPAKALLSNVLVLRTTPGLGNGAGTATTPGAGSLDFLLALDRADTAALIGAASQNVNLYFSLSNTSAS